MTADYEAGHPVDDCICACLAQFHTALSRLGVSDGSDACGSRYLDVGHRVAYENSALRIGLRDGQCGVNRVRLWLHEVWPEVWTADDVPHVRCQVVVFEVDVDRFGGVEKAGHKGLHFHDLRHTGNMLAAASGATVKDLMARMGHQSMAAALIYLHTNREADRRIADHIGAAMQAALTPKQVVSTAETGSGSEASESAG